jgi:pimeloyl-ACP methyl ester carboxylesterase
VIQTARCDRTNLERDVGLEGRRLAVLPVWGFECREVQVPTALRYDPGEKVLPAQHARWFADVIPNAMLVTTNALGHGSQGDPNPDWSRLNTWLPR